MVINKVKLTITCGICKRPIYLKKDNYVHIEDFLRGNFFKEGWYHTNCYNDTIKGHKDRMEKAEAILNKAADMIGFKEEKVYEIPY